MSKQLIESNPAFKKTVPQGEPFIDVSEFFCDTIQGENFVGWPAAFLRVQHCTQSCTWCDSKEVWRFGNPYTFDELFHLMEKEDFNRRSLITKFTEGQHLIFTGGSPTRIQSKLVALIEEFVKRYAFKPYIEIENECVLMPEQGLIDIVDCWNNSPKLSMSGNKDSLRYKPDVLKKLSTLDNSWFKFVVASEEDWKEIKRDFLDTELIHKKQIVLMPLGATRVELFENREKVLDIAIRENVRYSTREHTVIWDKKTGI